MMATETASGSDSSANTSLKLPALWSDNMVLQRGKDVPVWGTAQAGERVTVKLAGQEKSATADSNGKWMVRLSPLKEATGLTLSVIGINTITLKNVAVGDVYICSGQSNMEYALKGEPSLETAAGRDAASEVEAANHADIRLFSVPKAIRAEPLSDLEEPASWQVCTPESARGFSAVGYYFGRELHQKLGVPIGLINSSWGGTPAEAWTSRDTLSTMPRYQDNLAMLEEAFRNSDSAEERMAQWWNQSDPGIENGFASVDFDDAAWKTMTLPTFWEEAGLPDFDGVVWFRRVADVPAAWEGKTLNLHLGKIDDRDTTFWNGHPVGATNDYSVIRSYTISGDKVQAGRNTLAVGVLDIALGGGLYGGDEMRLELADAPNETSISLEGDWKYQATLALDKLPAPPAILVDNPNQTTVLYNGMIAPLVPFALRGAIWYQGESNAGDAVGYRTLFPALIRDWRRHFGQDFGFYFVQLANYLPRVEQPNEGGWAELREAQTMTLALPRTAMATIIDVGEADDIHPSNKRDVGKRLALAALANEYGQQIEGSGPMFAGLKTEGSSIRVTFSHAAGLKTHDGAPPLGFIIAGDNQKFAWAQARIEGETVVLSSDVIQNPTTVRYAWANNPATNLYNAADLPAVPFRSDAPYTSVK